MILERGLAFGRHLGHEGGAFMNVISPLIKEAKGACSPLPACGNTARRWLSRPSPDTKSAGNFTLDFSRTVIHKPF
jgi:hypothetical protein